MHRYFPDIYIPSEKRIIEVKSRFTLDQRLEKNFAIGKNCVNLGYKFEFQVYNRKGLLEELIVL